MASAVTLRSQTLSTLVSHRTLRRPTCTRARVSSVVVRASQSQIKPPAGVSLPPKQPEVPPAMFGFVDWAEKMNSRAAMIGFFSLLAIEAATGKGLLELVGWNIGSGLGFEL